MPLWIVCLLLIACVLGVYEVTVRRYEARLIDADMHARIDSDDRWRRRLCKYGLAHWESDENGNCTWVFHAEQHHSNSLGTEAQK